MNITPYRHQSQAIDTTLSCVDDGTNPVVVMPTGSGKSVVIADISRQLVDAGHKVLIVTHRKKLLQQNERHVNNFTGAIDIGVYSAGLKRRETGGDILLAGIQSVYNKPILYKDRTVVIIDEAHLIPPPGQGGMYDALLSKIPKATRIGLTATPYRLDSNGVIFGDGQWFDKVSYHAEQKALTPEFLAPLVSVQMLNEMDTKGVHIRRGDYVTKELEERAQSILGQTMGEAYLEAGRYGRKHILVFCVSITHAESVSQSLRDMDEKVSIMHGKMPVLEQDRNLAEFESSNTRWMVSVEQLTTGFDYPAIDCIVILRPTKSKALHVQMIGRAGRKADGKSEGLILDFAGNCQFHGDVDVFQETRTSTAKQAILDQEQEKEKERERQRRRRNEGRQSSMGGARPGQAVKRSSKVNAREGKNGQQGEIFPENLRLDRTSNPMTGGARTVAQVVAVNYELMPANKYPGKQNVVVKYTTRSGHKIRRWLCPEYETGAKWFAIKAAKSRGIQYPSSYAPEFLRQMMAAIAPTAIEISRDPKGYWQVDAEVF